MTKEIRSPNVEELTCAVAGFVITSDFVIRHSDLRIAVCSIKRPVSGLVRAAGGGSLHGESVCTDPLPSDGRGNSQTRRSQLPKRLDAPTDGGRFSISHPMGGICLAVLGSDAK